MDRLFAQNAKLGTRAIVVNPYYARTTWVVSKGPTLSKNLSKYVHTHTYVTHRIWKARGSGHTLTSVHDAQGHQPKGPAVALDASQPTRVRHQPHTGDKGEPDEWMNQRPRASNEALVDLLWQKVM